MNWGGIIAGAIGGGAQAIGQIADNNIKLRDQEAYEQRRAALDEARAEAAMNRKLSIEKKEREDSAAMEIKARDSAVKTGDERKFAKFKADIGESDASDEQLRGVFDRQYNGKVVAGDARYVDRDSVGQKDVVDELRKSGAAPSLIKSAMDEYKLQVVNEQRQDAGVRQDRIIAENERRNQANEDLRTKQIAGAIAKANGGGSGSREALAFLGEERKSLTADKQDLRAREAAVLKNVPDYDKEGKVKAKKEFDEANQDLIESIQQRSRFLDGSLAKVRDKVGLGDTGESGKTSPAGGPKVGAVVDGYRFMGGNPKDKSNWKK